MNEEQIRAEKTDELDVEGTTLCPRCLSRVDPASYYCETCGESAGHLTPYIPYVNIRFAVNFYSAMWRKAWYDHTAHVMIRLLCIVLIVLFAPIMLIGLPFVLLGKRKARTKGRTGA